MIKVLGIPFRFGQPREAVAGAPLVLREQGMIDDLERFDSVVCVPDLNFDDLTHEPQRVSLASERIKHCVLQELSVDSCLINVGGDHGLSLGTVSAVLEKNPETIVIWVDAHGDINTPESSRTKNFHGMPVSYLLGLNQSDSSFSWLKAFLRPEKLIYFGVRDLDPFERELIEALGIQCFSSQEINEQGAQRLLAQALEIADPTGSCPVHLSLDLDVLDQADFKATGIALPDGPRISEVKSLLGDLGHKRKILSMDIVEYLPQIGIPDERSYRIVWQLLEQLFAGQRKSLGENYCAQ